MTLLNYDLFFYCRWWKFCRNVTTLFTGYNLWLTELEQHRIQQDSSPAYCSWIAGVYMDKIFPVGHMGNHSSTDWPPRSPNASTANFFTRVITKALYFKESCAEWPTTRWDCANNIEMTFVHFTLVTIASKSIEHVAHLIGHAYLLVPLLTYSSLFVVLFPHILVCFVREMNKTGVM